MKTTKNMLSQEMIELAYENRITVLFDYKIKLYLFTLYEEAKKDTAENWNNIDTIIIPEIKNLEELEELGEYAHKIIIEDLSYRSNPYIRDAILSLYGHIKIPYDYRDSLINTVLKIAKDDDSKINRCRAVSILGKEELFVKIRPKKTEKIKETLKYLMKNDEYNRVKENAKIILEKYEASYPTNTSEKEQRHIIWNFLKNV